MPSDVIENISGLTLFCRALTLTIGLSSLSSGAYSQYNASASDDEIINQIRNQCGFSKVPVGAGESDILESFSGDNPTQTQSVMEPYSFCSGSTSFYTSNILASLFGFQKIC